MIRAFLLATSSFKPISRISAISSTYAGWPSSSVEGLDVAAAASTNPWKSADSLIALVAVAVDVDGVVTVAVKLFARLELCGNTDPAKDKAAANWPLLIRRTSAWFEGSSLDSFESFCSPSSDSEFPGEVPKWRRFIFWSTFLQQRVYL